jgi:GT2 family glycosyltransferase
VEVGCKTKLAGYKIILAPKSICYHKFEFSRSVKKIYFMERNRFLFTFSFYELTTILVIIPALLIMELGQLAFALLRGWWPEKLKAYAYFLRPNTWRKLLAERKRIQSSRVIMDKYFAQDLVSEIFSQEIDNPILKKIANPFFKAYWKIALKFIEA